MKKLLIYALFLLVVFSLFSCGVKEPDDQTLALLDKYVEDNGGIYESQDLLISLYPSHEKSAYTDDYETVKAFAESCDIPVYVAFPPRKMDSLTTALPNDFPVSHSEYLYRLADSIVSKSDAEYIDLYSVLRETEGTYFNTDHHWTDKGAFLAYLEISETMGFSPLVFDELNTEVLIENWRGSDFSKKNTATAVDTITGTYPDGEFLVERVEFHYDSGENNTSFEGFFDYGKLSSNEPYAVYLGGNHPYIRVKKVGETRPVLLIVRDSFANALAPYLAEHYDLVLIDPRFYPEGISKAVERENATAVLILENMGSITESELKIKW